MATLTEISTCPGFYFYEVEGRGGSLVREDFEGDTLLPPFRGCFTSLGEARSLEEATKLAEEWQAQSGTAYCNHCAGVGDHEDWCEPARRW
jgi:hypothetical protein